MPLKKCLVRSDIFFYSPVKSKRGLWLDQLDAMFVQLKTGISPINGNLNVIPEPWELLAVPNIDSTQDELRIKTGLTMWKNIFPIVKEKKTEWIKMQEINQNSQT